MLWFLLMVTSPLLTIVCGELDRQQTGAGTFSSCSSRGEPQEMSLVYTFAKMQIKLPTLILKPEIKNMTISCP